MGHTYDFIVLGVGGMGSATLYHLARRGHRVLGLERFNIPHAMGSSHGVTRIIRMAYFEHPSYVPLLRRVYALWRELQQDAEEQLLHITGSLDIGPPNSPLFQGSKSSCETHELTHQIFTGAELSQQFPAYRLPDEYMAVYQPEGGFVLPERSIVSHVVLAQRHGAEVHGCEQVLSWEATANEVHVKTDHGEYSASRLVITAGAWASKLVSCLSGVASPERRVLIWMRPHQPELFSRERFPVFNMASDQGQFYGFPVFGVPGFKFGHWHHFQEKVDADTIDRSPNLRDEKVLRDFAERYFPQGAGPTLSMSVCMFTNSPDGHFILDFHPEYSQVTIAAGFSGHGFKFCPVVGEIMADLAETGVSRFDLEMFKLGSKDLRIPAAKHRQ
jgi:sarcosine oxidase